MAVQQCHRPVQRSPPWWLWHQTHDHGRERREGTAHAAHLHSKQLTRPLVPPQIGVMGLIEKDWLVSLGAVDPHEVKYTDFVQAGSRLAAQLRSDGAEFVVAITHMREHNDKRVATDVQGVDLVLGGHDHFYKCVGQGGAGDGVHHA